MLLYAPAFCTPVIVRPNVVVFDPLPPFELVISQLPEVYWILAPPFPVRRYAGTADGLPVSSSYMRQSLNENKRSLVPGPR